jgi:hypothetical protein
VVIQGDKTDTRAHFAQIALPSENLMSRVEDLRWKNTLCPLCAQKINKFNNDFYSPEQGLQPDSLLKHGKINLNLF